MNEALLLLGIVLVFVGILTGLPAAGALAYAEQLGILDRIDREGAVRATKTGFALLAVGVLLVCLAL